MKVEEKIKIVEEVKNKLSQSKAIWFTDFTGLSVENMMELRRNLREKSLSYQVMKKNILKRALKGLEIDVKEEWMEGPVGICIGDDIVIGSRALTDFQKEKPNFKIKGSWFEGRKLSLPELREIASLPDREVLIATLIGNLSSPIVSFVRVLRELLMKIMWVLIQIKEKQERR